MIDDIIYTLEGLLGDVYELVNEDREYFLERREELLEHITLLENTIKEI